MTTFEHASKLISANSMIKFTEVYYLFKMGSTDLKSTAPPTTKEAQIEKNYILSLFTILALGMTGLIACDDGGIEATEDEEETAQAEQEEDEENEGQISGGGLIWNYMPVYPGASQIAKGAWSIPPAEDDWAKMEWRYYETGDGADKVASYYKSKMSGQGWSEQAWMEAGMFFWGYFTKNNESDGAIV